MNFQRKTINIILILLFNITWVLSLIGCSQSIDPPAPYGAIPTERQLKWHEMEMYGMVCFGLNTFTGQEWGYGNVSPALFNPVRFDADQIVSVAKSAGLKGLILVAKHHDGFCLWPTKTTDYNISKSPWKNGKGDLVKEFSEACREQGLKFGIYCSPWDRNNGLYGSPEYVKKIYRTQIKELCTNYGDLFMLWFDGANGGDGYYSGTKEKRIIDRSSYYGWYSTWSMVRKLQPNAVIFSDIGPDVRWVGNEKGHAAKTSWATFTPQPLPGKDTYGPGDIDYTHSPIGTRDGRYWIPAECDVPLRPGWFYHSDQDSLVKTPYQLFDLYLKSVGRGAGLDIGLAPDKTGQLSRNDVVSLSGFGQLLKKTFKVNLAENAKLNASNVRGNDTDHFGPQNLLDGNRYSYWATDDSITTPQLILHLKGIKKFDIISIRENIKLGQRVESFAIDAKINGRWKQIAQATSIGNLRLIHLPEYISTNSIRLRVTKSPVCPSISDFGLYAEPGLTVSSKDPYKTKE